MTQPLSTREQLKVLEHLQELDLRIDGLKRNKGSLPAALKSLDDSLLKLKAEVTLKQTALGEIEKTQRQARAAIDLNQDRLSRSSARLEGVQNSHEFQAVQKELEQLRKLASQLDEQIKKSEQDHQALQKEIEGVQAQSAKVQGDRDAQATALGGQDAQLDTEIGALTAERDKLMVGVDPRILSQYNRVRAARAGLGIVPAVAGRCKGCNMVVPPQLYNEVQKGLQFLNCPSCHRILLPV